MGKKKELKYDEFNFANCIQASLKGYDDFSSGKVDYASVKKIIKAGNKAREALIQHNISYVYSIAKEYKKKTKVCYEDLVQAGSLGLVTAANRFLPTRNNKFITFAVYYIENEIKKYINSEDYIYFPREVKKNLALLKSEISRFVDRSGKFPTISDLSERLNLPKTKICSLIGYLDGPLCLDNEFDDGLSYLDVVPSDSTSPLQAMLNKESSGLAAKIMHEVLDEIEEYILNNYLGLYCEKRSFLAISRDLGISAEGVRKKYLKAIDTIKNSKYCDLLYDSVVNSD